MRKQRKMKGFTLVELLIVLLILGILIGLAVPRYLTALEKSKETTFCANIRSIVSAMETYRMQNATTAYPASAEVLNASIITSTVYFSQPPINPYTGEVMGAVELAGDATSVAGDDGIFAYRTEGGGLNYVIFTIPDCNLQ